MRRARQLDSRERSRTLAVVASLQYSMVLSNCARFVVLLTLFSWHCETKISASFDYFLLVQEWPPAICKTSYSNCQNPPGWSYQPRWTIHGLWPTIDDTEGPAYCNNSWKFNLTALNDLMPQLLYNWPNILVDSDSNISSFWEHEWTKHGTCASLRTEHDYFAATLNAYHTFNVTYQALSNSGIIPSSTDTYEIDKIYDALSTAYQVKPIVVCGYDNSLGQYIEQVEICLDKNFKPFDCGDSAERPSCRSNQNVKYFATSDKI